jgi:hypothetical protein
MPARAAVAMPYGRSSSSSSLCASLPIENHRTPSSRASVASDMLTSWRHSVASSSTALPSRAQPRGSSCIASYPASFGRRAWLAAHHDGGLDWSSLTILTRCALSRPEQAQPRRTVVSERSIRAGPRPLLVAQVCPQADGLTALLGPSRTPRSGPMPVRVRQLSHERPDTRNLSILLTCGDVGRSLCRAVTGGELSTER